MARLRAFVKHDYISKKTSESPIYFEYTHNNERTRFSTGLKLDPLKYKIVLDEDTEIFKITTSEKCSNEKRKLLQQKNEEIRRIHLRFKEAITRLQREGKLLHPKSVEQEYNTLNTATIDPIVDYSSDKTIIQWFDEFIKAKEKEIGMGIKSYRGTYNNLKAFISTRPITKFTELRLSVLEEFRTHLTNKGLRGTTIHKQFKNLRIFLSWVKDHDDDDQIAMPHAYSKIDVRARYADPIGLTKEKFIELYKLDLSAHKELERTRDLFIFGVSIGGPRYGDLKKIGDQLRQQKVTVRDLTITYYESKTGNFHEDLQLNLFGLEILEKHHFIFPHVPSLNRMNKNLKAIGKKLKWTNCILVPHFNALGKIVKETQIPLMKLLSTKFMRKTAMTIDQELGIPTKISMKRSGHTTFEAHSRYVAMDKKDLSNANKIWNSLFPEKIDNSYTE